MNWSKETRQRAREKLEEDLFVVRGIDGPFVGFGMDLPPNASRGQEAARALIVLSSLEELLGEPLDPESRQAYLPLFAQDMIDEELSAIAN